MVFPGLSVEVPMHLKVSRAARKFLDRSLEDAAAAEALVGGVAREQNGFARGYGGYVGSPSGLIGAGS